LRALAVGAVLLFHAGHLSGGFLGVDTFFVISGFLITGLLLREAESTGGVGLGEFWARRARRLLPALALMVCAVTLWSLRFGTAAERLALNGDTLWSLSFMMNWHEIAAAHDYWSSFALQSPLTHLWSLAVEEQFYLVWPLVMLAVVRWARRPQRMVLGICAAGASVSFVLMTLLYDPATSTRVYEGTDTRIGAMLIGGLCATTPVRSWVSRILVGATARTKALASVSLLASGAGILWMYSFASGSNGLLFRGGFFAFALAIGLVIAAITTPTNTSPLRALEFVRTMLSFRTLRSIGRLSYGLYLWHWPIFLVLSPLRTGLGEWPLLALRLVVTWVVALGSYHLVEHPVRVGLQRLPHWMSAPATALAVGVAALVAVTVALPQASATAISVDSIAALTTASGLPTSPVRAASVGARRSSSPALDGIADADRASPGAAATSLVPAKRGLVHRIVLFGDSIAYTTAPAIVAAFQAGGMSVESAAGPGVGLINRSGQFDFLDTVSPAIDGQTILVVVQLSVWDAKYGEQSEYDALTLLHQFVVDRHGQLVILSAPPLRADQDKGGQQGLIAAARHVERDWPGNVSYLDASDVWGDHYVADLNGDHVPERMYDGVHMCASGAALVGAWLVAEIAERFDGIKPAALADWAGGAWTQNPIYSTPAGACAAV
jgi:peptidoglycan/LPS O-acetylase OafA/YrhL